VKGSTPGFHRVCSRLVAVMVYVSCRSDHCTLQYCSGHAV